MNILLVARHYPPEVSGGARRPFLTATAMRARGHSVCVITPFTPQHSDDVQVPGPDLAGRPGFRATSLLTWLVRWRYFPDPEIVWARKVIGYLRRLPAPDILITTSPPESTHMVGMAMKDLHPETKWLAEFRDTWTVQPHRREAARWPRRPMERWLARRILARADGISAVSAFVMEEVGRYTSAPQHIEGHFADAPKAEHSFGDGFHLLHSGGFALSDHRRSLSALFADLDPIADARADLRLHITGWLDDSELDLCELRPWTTLHGQVDLATSRAMQAGADALLLVTPPDSHALPGKYAEYSQTGRPVIAVGGGGWRGLLPSGAEVHDPDALRNLPPGSRASPLKTLSSDAAAGRLESFLSQM